MEKIGAAVVGAGIYGQVHIRTYKADPRVDLIAIWSRSQEKAKRVGEEYGCHFTTDIDAIVSNKRINVVSIATPDFAHSEAAVKMLKAGKNILLEKPMATSVKECQHILGVYNHQRSTFDEKPKLMVNFHNRWYPPVAEAKRIIERGDIGAPVTFYARLSDRIEVATQWLSWAGQSGPEWFLLPHIVDLARWLIGKQKVGRVFALGRKGILQDRGVDCLDAIQAQVEFEDTIATFESSWILPSSWPNVVDFKIDILGSKGRIGIVGDKEGIEVAADKYQTPFVLDPVTEEEPIRYFIDCVMKDRSPEPTGEDGIAVTEIIEALLRSVKEGRAIGIAETEKRNGWRKS